MQRDIGKVKYYPWVAVGLLWVVALLNYLDRQMLSTMKPAMMIDITELESAANFGRLMAVFLWIYGLISPVAGMIADRINRKWLIVGSLFVWSFVTFMMGYCTNFDQIYILRALMGVSEALYIPAGLALIADYHEENTRSLAIGIHMTGLYAGQALGGFGATVAGAYSWETTFHTFGMIGIVYSVVLMIFLHEKKGHAVKPQLLTGKPEENPLKGALKGLGVVLANISFWLIMFYFATPSLPGWATKNWLPTLFAENLSIEMAVAGPMSTITIAAASFAGVIFGGVLSDKWIRKNVRGRIYTGAIGLGLTVPALLLLGFGHNLVMIIGGGLCFGIGYGMFDANNMPILCQFISPRYRATAYGIMNMTGVFAGAAITNLLGKSTDAGKLGRDFALLAGVVLFTLIIQLVFLRPKTANMTTNE
jgi:MFS family permease